MKLKNCNYPFDNTATSHSMLVNMLNTDFKDVFSNQTEFMCETTGFKMMHQLQNMLSNEFYEKYNRRLQRFRELRNCDTKIIFLRYLSQDSVELSNNTIQNYNSVHQALKNFGFNNYDLYYATNNISIDHPKFFGMYGKLPEVEPWNGNDEDWNNWIAKIIKYNEN